ncbi:hypothetical protein [Spongiactinospora sp. TRM90649]|uniref:MmyB family transcriptional regulator n=1 Tax=Spongiactinospora sp. TRM90649 TaxID=3031114 RepID=UPI0023F76DF3|nr:hypothetical protein [Spongiactinospora sp. TRM90649]MDF5758856.1 hypothetical protein [Spongiactinospora sp. TRM90649]
MDSPRSRALDDAVRLAGVDLLYLGTVRQSRSTWEREPHLLQDCVLRLDRPLGLDLLDQVRPPSEPGDLPGLDWLERIGTDRPAALRLLIEGRHPPAAPAGDDHRPSPLRVPPMLAGPRLGDLARSPIIQRLLSVSEEFGAAWRDHRIEGFTSRERLFHHPTAGVLRYEHHRLAFADQPDPHAVIYTPAAPAA